MQCVNVYCIVRSWRKWFFAFVICFNISTEKISPLLNAFKEIGRHIVIFSLFSFYFLPISRIHVTCEQYYRRAQFVHLHKLKIACTSKTYAIFWLCAPEIYFINPVATIEYFRKSDAGIDNVNRKKKKNEKMFLKCNICVLYHRPLSCARCGWLAPVCIIIIMIFMCIIENALINAACWCCYFWCWQNCISPRNYNEKKRKIEKYILHSNSAESDRQHASHTGQASHTHSSAVVELSRVESSQ